MTISVIFDDENDTILVLARAEGDGIRGDVREEISNGGSFGDVTFATLKAAGEGGHRYDDLLRRQSACAADHLER